MPRPIVSNEDILQVIQDHMTLTSEGFVRLESRMDRFESRMDGMESRMDGMESRMDRFESRMDRFESRMDRFESLIEGTESRMGRFESSLHQQGRDIVSIKNIVERIDNEQQAQTHDIGEILDRIVVLEKKATLDEAERQEAKLKLQALINWTQAAAKQLDIPLNLPSTSR